jgi:hypothetical protein
MKCTSPGAAKRITRKSPGGFQKQIDKQRELNKQDDERYKNALKRRRAELETQ